jgi:hypothetical protein
MGTHKGDAPGEATATVLFVAGVFGIMGSVYLLLFNGFSVFSLAFALGGVLIAAICLAGVSVVENVRAIRLMTAEMLEQQKHHGV